MSVWRILLKDDKADAEKKPLRREAAGCRQSLSSARCSCGSCAQLAARLCDPLHFRLAHHTTRVTVQASSMAEPVA